MTAPISTSNLGERTVGEIAAALPSATSVFHSFDIDFCCNGDLTLQEAVDRANVDLNEVALALAALDGSEAAGLKEAAAAVASMSSDELIAHIESRYHAAHRLAIPQLVALSRKVEQVHQNNPKVPAGLADTLEKIGVELEAHMTREEQSLFPAMRQAATGLETAIGELKHDHSHQGKLVHEIERICDKFDLPEDACGSWNMLYAKTSELTQDLMEHIHLENNVLFPRFASAHS